MNTYIINWFNNGDFVMTDRECFKSYELAKIYAEHHAPTQLSNNCVDAYDIVEICLND